MKKLLSLFTFIVLCSCSEDYYENTDGYYQPSSYINPPVWIQGTWKDDKDRIIIFTEDELFYGYPLLPYKSVSSEILDYERYYQTEYNKYRDANVQEAELINYYSIKYNAVNAPSKKFRFIKLSETKIESTDLMPGIYIRQNY